MAAESAACTLRAPANQRDQVAAALPEGCDPQVGMRNGRQVWLVVVERFGPFHATNVGELPVWAWFPSLRALAARLLDEPASPRVCSWCRQLLGWKVCSGDDHGETSGLCDGCARALAEEAA